MSAERSHTPLSSAGQRHTVMYVTFGQLSSKFLRSKTFDKTMASKESLRDAVCECTELTYPWTIRTICADLMTAHLMSATHSQTKHYLLTQTGLMEHSANMHVTELVNHGSLTFQVHGSHELWNREHDHGLPAGQPSSCLTSVPLFLSSLRHMKCESIA